MKARRGGGIKQSFINLSHFPPIGVVVLPFFLLHATVYCSLEVVGLKGNCPSRRGGGRGGRELHW